MGCPQSNGMDEAYSTSKNWDKVLQRDRLEDAKIRKLLLLGTGNSGKSTFFKQLTQIHGGGFTNEHFTAQARHIQESAIIQMKNLLRTFDHAETDVSESKSELPSELIEAANKVTHIALEQQDIPLLQLLGNEIAQLWAHQAIKDAYINRTDLGVADSAAYFFDDLDRLRAEEYRPTAQDLLLARIPTTGMLDKKFKIKDFVFNVFDVGGQRSERNKWIHCFDSVHGILFVASLSCYDQRLFEDNELNAMDEALELFGIVVNSRYFEMASMMLFLNKSDLFHEKIKTKPLTICFPEYQGEDTFDDTVEYIREKFKEQVSNRKSSRTIYSHITCATDQENVRKLFDDVQHTVVTNSLKYNGIL